MTSPTQKAISNVSQRWKKRSGQLFFSTWMGSAAILIVWGFMVRDQDYVSPERGLGYWLGITGGSMFLLLLTYSMRKRWRTMRKLFTVRFWFQLHMTLGVVGTLLVLFHSNFSLGSLNSNLALFSVLIVSASGLAGRFLYTRIHYGLYGKKIHLQQAWKDFQTLKIELTEFAITQKQKLVMEKLFAAMEELIVKQKDNPNIGFIRLYFYHRKAQKVVAAMAEFMRRLEAYHLYRPDSHYKMTVVHRTLQRDCAILLSILGKLPSLLMFEKLFSFWHVVHIPVFMVMIITAVTHVVVVHMY